MNPLAALREKPWLSPGIAPAAPGRADAEAAALDRSVGVNLFLLVVTVIFGLVTMAYMMRMGHGLPDAARDWAPFREPPLLWLNTAILAASSLAFAVADRRARSGDMVALRRALLLGGVLGAAFLAGQIFLWRELSDWRFALRYGGGLCRVGDVFPRYVFPATILGNPALAFLYLISGLHAAHILGGLAAWGIAARGLARGSAEALRNVRLCARYWHFLLLVWVAMMGLFVAT